MQNLISRVISKQLEMVPTWLSVILLGICCFPVFRYCNLWNDRCDIVTDLFLSKTLVPYLIPAQLIFKKPKLGSDLTIGYVARNLLLPCFPFLQFVKWSLRYFHYLILANLFRKQLKIVPTWLLVMLPIPLFSIIVICEMIIAILLFSPLLVQTSKISYHKLFRNSSKWFRPDYWLCWHLTLDL